MTTIRFRSPVTRPLYPPRGDKPRIADEFYVTQRFDDLDYYWSQVDPAKAAQKHRATDIGNGRCGYPIVAMAAGTAYRIKDNATAYGAPNDALGVRVDHGHGVITEYWHLDSQTVANGARVSAGQEVGKLGKTGLGQVCHCHITCRVNGVLRDPEPLMFGGAITLGQEVDDVKIKGKFLRHVVNRRGALTSDSHFRAGVLAGDDDSLTVFKRGTAIVPTLVVEGRSAGTAPDKAEWYGAWLYVDGSGWNYGYVHSSVLPRSTDGKGVTLDPVEASGYSSDDLNNARHVGFIAGRDKAAAAAKAVTP